MQGTQIVHSYHIPGTLAADITITFTAYRAMTLQHVSAVAGNDSDATLAIGVSGSTASIMAATAIGDSGVPAEFGRSDWASTDPYGAIADGDVVVFTLDYDGSAGTAAQNVTIVATFTEG